MVQKTYGQSETKTADTPVNEFAEPGRIEVSIQYSQAGPTTQHSVELPYQQLIGGVEDGTSEAQYHQATYVPETGTLTATDSDDATEDITEDAPEETLRTLEELCGRLESNSTPL
nr:MAG: hypothetical protein J07AB56_06680 [Candidatus Nanosalinarum sp. J07AB56]